MKITSAEFEVSAPDLDACPSWALPEFAFIGRSNVGKSSLINLLTERRDLAKVSDLPGKTRLLNFYVINQRWSLVDLPGYGYAQVRKTERSAFNAAVNEFLEERRNLVRVFVLIDSRLPPQANDLEFVRWLGHSHPHFALIFTKADKQSAAQSQANIALFKAKIGEWRTEMPDIFLCSSKTKHGRMEILTSIEASLANRNRASG
jgi:GTP-binding protein